MYLSLLKENEKEVFLGLAITLSSSDGNISSEENEMIGQYCSEMGISKTTEILKDESDLIAEICENADVSSKKIIVFELIGLAMADNSYDECEKRIISKMISKFGLPNNYSDSCEKIIFEYLSFQDKINNLVLG